MQLLLSAKRRCGNGRKKSRGLMLECPYFLTSIISLAQKHFVFQSKGRSIVLGQNLQDLQSFSFCLTEALFIVLDCSKPAFTFSFLSFLELCGLLTPHLPHTLKGAGDNADFYLLIF